jgi:TetR/AcrR family transcriptional regulator
MPVSVRIKAARRKCHSMYETFEKLPQYKKEQILQVCIEEFAQNGYESASTNTIVKRLGISKGVLFLYFSSKKNLYLYIVNYLTRTLTDEFFQYINSKDEKGPLEIFDHLGEFYYDLIKEKPHVLKFMMDAFLNPPVDMSEAIQYEHELAHEKAMERISLDKLKEDIDPKMVVDLMHMISYHVGQMIFKDYSGNIDGFRENIDRYTETFNEYIRIIKYGIYKQNP